jgi:hypothetical protein
MMAVVFTTINPFNQIGERVSTTFPRYCFSSGDICQLMID